MTAPHCMLSPLSRLLFTLPFCVALLCASGEGWAEPTTFADNHILFEVPEGVSITELQDDDRGTIYTFGGMVAPIDVYVIKLDAEGIKNPAQHGRKMFARFINIQKKLDLEPKGRTKLEMNGCEATSWSYRDGDFQTRLAGCAHPSLPRYYIFHLEMEEAIADKSQEMVKAFHAILMSNVALLDEAGNPLSREPASVLTIKKPAGDADSGKDTSGKEGPSENGEEGTSTEETSEKEDGADAGAGKEGNE